MRIRTKFIAPVAAILILAILCGLFALDRLLLRTLDAQEKSVTRFTDDTVAERAFAQVEEIYSNIDRFARQALEKAALFSRSPVVQRAYEIAQTGNLDDPEDPRVQEGRELLRRELASIMEGYKRATGEDEFKLHFHLPNGRSFARLWRDGWQTKVNGKKVDISDDISGFRQTVVDINRGEHTPLTGIEAGRGGFDIRGLAPVSGPGGEHLGSCELLYPFGALIDTVLSGEDVQLAVYMNAELLSVATSFQDATKYPIVDGKYVLTAASRPELTDRLITADLLARGALERVHKNLGDHFVVTFPLKDYSGKGVGVMALTYDLSRTALLTGEMKAQAEAAVAGMRTGMGGGALLILLAVIGTIVLVARKVTSPLARAVLVTEAIAQGDLSEEIGPTGTDEAGAVMAALKTMIATLREKVRLAEEIASGNLQVEVSLASEKDQLGRALKTMTESLNGILGQIQSAGEQIASGSTQVADASQSLSQGATEQASSLEEISASMNELGSQTKLNAENAAQASQLSSRTKASAEGGNAKMQQMVAAMAEINEAGQSIGKIIKTIDEIAFQTNLLALNAAVEAARAGQHGKGFAVVAEEVRNLAARSARAARETAELIEGSIRKAENGAGIADETAAALGEIVSGITKVSDLVGEIAAASNEQAQGIGQVNTGLGQIDQVTQQNTASAEQSAAAAQELSGQADELRRMLARFRLKGESVAQRALPEPKPVSAPAAGGWAQAPAAAPRPRKAAPESAPAPSRVIALDDEEFGKY